MGRPEDVPFVARSDELATVRTLLERAREGSSAVLVIGGEAGVGRTRLVEAIADAARRDGFRVATGTCVRMDAGAMPYLAIIAALRALVAQGDPATVAASLGGQRREIARLLPEVARLGVPVDRDTVGLPAVPAGPRAMPAPAVAPGSAGSTEREPLERLRLFEAVTTWLARLADAAPLLLVIDDLQWVDPSTLDLLRALAPALAHGSVLVVSLRTDQPLPGAVGATVAELVRDGATRLELAPFERNELERLVAAATGTDVGAVDPAALDHLTARSGGNAFLALALIDAGLVSADAPYVGVPASLRDILDAELASLDDETLAMLRAAALEPGPLDDAVLAGVLEVPVTAVGRAIREAHHAGVLAIGRGVGAERVPRFRHAIQREVLVDQLGHGEQRSLHARYADVLESADLDPSRASAVALHRDGAGDGPRALAAHLAAMDAAERAFAFDAAARHGTRAAALRRGIGVADPGTPDEAGLLGRASYAALLAGDAPAAAELARRALATTEVDDARAAVLHDRIRWALWLEGDRAGSARELELAFERLGDAPPDALRAHLLAERAAMRTGEADPRAALDLAHEAIGIARAVGAPEIEALGLGILGRALATHGRVDEGIDSLRAAVGIADRIGNLQGRMVGLATIVAVLASCGRSREALDEADAATAIADASGL
ncbi:MAG TPA: AAA family ATPase, partial [Candidatus Limnocylindrales bacterium]